MLEGVATLSLRQAAVQSILWSSRRPSLVGGRSDRPAYASLAGTVASPGGEGRRGYEHPAPPPGSVGYSRHRSYLPAAPGGQQPDVGHGPVDAPGVGVLDGDGVGAAAVADGQVLLVEVQPGQEP